MEKKNSYKIFSLILIFLSFVSFFLGFYLNENSAGAGTYGGDFDFIWTNIQIFQNHDLISAIKHPDYFTNRPPLIYVLHSLLNPFLETEIGYRRSVFVISLAVPALFFFCLRQKFEKVDNILLLLISSTICLSPYFRTSAYWGLEENYSFISLLLTFLCLNNFLNNKDEDGYKIYSQLFLTTLFSSSCLYFDQKFILIPLICFFTIILSEKLIKFKIFSIISYFILFLPFVSLIIFWGGLNSPATAEANINSITLITRIENIYWGHLGYALTIIAFYFFPLLFFKEENFNNLFKSFFLKSKNYYLIFLFFIYLFYLIIFFDFEKFTTEKYWIGLGYIHKISVFLFSNILFQKILTYFAFFISWIIILIFVERNFKNVFITFYFLLLSLFLWPLMQEYFDPFILLMLFTFFNIKLFISYKNSIFLFLYLATFLIGVNIYYLYFAIYPVG